MKVCLRLVGVFLLLVCDQSASTLSGFSNSVKGMVFFGELVINGFFLNSITVSPSVEAVTFRFFRRQGPPVESDESTEDDEDEIRARVEPQITSLNRDHCLAKLLCGMSHGASQKGTKADYYKDYAELISKYFQIFGNDDKESRESFEAYDDDYSLEDEEPPKKSISKFDIGPGLMDDSRNPNASIIEYAGDGYRIGTEKPAVSRIMYHRIARAQEIVANANHRYKRCQSITGCQFTFKDLRQKIKTFGTNGNVQAPIRQPVNYQVHSLEVMDTKSTSVESEEDGKMHQDPNRGDDELDEVLGQPTISLKSKKTKKPATSTTTEAPATRKTVTEKVPSRRIKTTTTTTTPRPPRRKVSYKRPPTKEKVKDNGDDEFDDVNKTTPIKLVETSFDGNDTSKVEVQPPKKKKAKPQDDEENSDEDDDNEEDEEEEEEEDEEDEEEDEEEDGDRRKRKGSQKKLIVEGDENEAKKMAEDDEADQKDDFWGGLTFDIKHSKSNPKRSSQKKNKKIVYKVQKNKAQENDDNDEEDDDDDGGKPARHETKKFDIKKDVGPTKYSVGKRKQEEQNEDEDQEEEKEETSEEDDANERLMLITGIGGRPLAPPAEVPTSLKGKEKSSTGAMFKFIKPHKPEATPTAAIPTFINFKYGSSSSSNANKKPKDDRVSSSLMPSSFASLQGQSQAQAQTFPTASQTIQQNGNGNSGMFSGFSPFSTLTKFFRKPSPSSEPSTNVNFVPLPSPYIKRPIGPESSQYRRPAGSTSSKKHKSKNSSKND